MFMPSLVMANGAVMEGIETNVFFTFFGLEGITKKSMNHLHTATTGNPAMKMPGGIPFPTMLGGLPGVESAVSGMMRKQMEELDMPPVDEFLEMITAGGGTIYACKLAVDMFKLKKEDLSDEVDSVLSPLVNSMNYVMEIEPKSFLHKNIFKKQKPLIFG